MGFPFSPSAGGPAGPTSPSGGRKGGGSASQVSLHRAAWEGLEHPLVGEAERPERRDEADEPARGFGMDA